MIALHFKSGASYELCDGVHSPLRAAVVSDAILDPSVADHPHHRDAIADPDFDCERVGALAVPRYLHLAVPFTAVYLAASRCFCTSADETVLLNELVEVPVRFSIVIVFSSLRLLLQASQRKPKKS